MKKHLKEAAEICAKSPAIRKEVIGYIKNGRGYSDPTDLYDDFDFEKVPKKYHKYFSEPEEIDNAETPEEARRLEQAWFDAQKLNPMLGCLYSVDGTVALFDAVLAYKRK